MGCLFEKHDNGKSIYRENDRRIHQENYNNRHDYCIKFNVYQKGQHHRR